MADQPTTPTASPEDVAKLAAEQEKEYGTYVAVQPISFNGVPAYNVGESVPVSNVQKYKYDEQGVVAKITSKSAQDVVAAIQSHSTNVDGAPSVSLGVSVK